MTDGGRMVRLNGDVRRAMVALFTPAKAHEVLGASSMGVSFASVRSAMEGDQVHSDIAATLERLWGEWADRFLTEWRGVDFVLAP